MVVHVRRATHDDADALCDVHVRGWQVGYAHVYSHELLHAPAFTDARLAGWRRRQYLDGPSTCFVADDDGRVIGFTQVGPERVDEGVAPTGRGEVYSFYVHPDAWGTGAADAMMGVADGHLAGAGHREAVLWVLDDNPRARRFYERHGWRPTGERATFTGPTMPGIPATPPVTEVQYAVVLTPTSPNDWTEKRP